MSGLWGMLLRGWGDGLVEGSDGRGMDGGLGGENG